MQDRCTRHPTFQINVLGTPLLMAQGAEIKGTGHEPKKTRSTAHRASEVAVTFPPRRVCSTSVCSRQSGCVSSFSSTSFLEPCGACTCPLHADGVPRSRDGRPPRGSNRWHGNVGSRNCGRAFPRADSGSGAGQRIVASSTDGPQTFEHDATVVLKRRVGLTGAALLYAIPHFF